MALRRALAFWFKLPSLVRSTESGPMSRTPRDSAYMRVAAGGDYDSDWDDPYAPPPPPKLKRVELCGNKPARRPTTR